MTDEFPYAVTPEHEIPRVMTPWEGQAAQFAKVGEPGLGYEQRTIGPPDNTTIVDCLTYRDPNGMLFGILYHYNENNPFQAPDTITILVDPDRQREGAGTALLREATTRWAGIEEKGFANQTWTPESMAFVDALVAKGIVDEARTVFRKDTE